MWQSIKYLFSKTYQSQAKRDFLFHLYAIILSVIAFIFSLITFLKN